ncbi:MAG: hypothetical protein AAFP93_00870 [Bacteroidota bacterium]
MNIMHAINQKDIEEGIQEGIYSAGYSKGYAEGYAAGYVARYENQKFRDSQDNATASPLGYRHGTVGNQTSEGDDETVN